MVEPNAFTLIMLAEAGTYNISEDINLYSAHVAIAITLNVLLADVNFVSYTDAGENSLYGFNLYAGSSLAIWAQHITIDAPYDAGNDWVEGIACVRVYNRESDVTFAGYTSISFSATGATGTDLPALAVNKITSSGIGKANLTVITNSGVVTNEKGYILNADYYNASLNLYGTVDYVLYIVAGGVTQQSPTLISGVIGDTTGGGTTLSIRSGSEAIATGTGTETDSALVTLMTDAYGNIDGGDVVGLKTTTGGNLVAVQIAISGDSAKVIIGDIKSVANTTTYLDVVQGYEIKNINIQTNIYQIK
jgi:hypothetical protein